MKVSIVRGGGVGGFVTRTELEASRLDAAARPAFESELEKALTVEQTGAGGAVRQPDEQRYQVSLESDQAQKTFTFLESELPGQLRSLIDWTDARPERTTALETPG